MDAEQLATTVARTMTPFTPFLLKLGQTGGDKSLMPVGNQPGWQEAQAVWQGIQTHFPNDTGIQGAAMMLSGDPGNHLVQNLLVQNLGRRIQESPQLAEALIKALGGEQAIQQIKATGHSIIENVEQSAQGSGSKQQTVEAFDGSTIRGVKQNIG
ncbi:MAG: hypothetical protein KA314_23870 [Chloroflexi bacterium]|nr:hypothetical protein [Chloroflexota bacterium]MBP8058883.1 hypothetical protein [Chloroflexota bacterium]